MRQKWLILVFLVFGLVWLSFLRLGDLSYVLKISKEDGHVEYTTALFFLIGFIVGVYSIYLRKKLSAPIVIPAIWTILCFLFLGEETSWFQRIFNYSIYAVELVSHQGEFNLHNLGVFNEGGFIADGKINRMSITERLISSQNIFRMGFFGYFLIIPILWFMSNKIEAILSRMGYIKPSNTVLVIMLIVFVFSFALVLISPIEFKSPIAESREMLYAMFIMIYMIVYIRPKEQMVAK
tara:strand:+ start:365 stop:1075 length:711 start_codon:yes stop_codon:yes gene_type:complete